MGQDLKITVRQALEHTLKKGFADVITLKTLKAVDSFEVIGVSDDYQNALVMFNEFLDAGVAGYRWDVKDGRKTADIIIRKCSKMTSPSGAHGITTLKEALAEIEMLKCRIKKNNESYEKLEKKNNELQKQNRILERENYDLHERLNNQGLVAMSALANALSSREGFVPESEVDALRKENDRLRSEMSWEWENRTLEERERNERGEQGIFG